MTDEILKKALEVKKQIDIENDIAFRLNEFLNRKRCVDARIKTPQDSCLEYTFTQEEIEHVIKYLVGIHRTKRDLLQLEFDGI